jgi:hypothetical protein
MSDFMDDTEKAISQTVIDIDTDDAIEPMTVDEGEYEVRITAVMKNKDSKEIIRNNSNGDPFFMLQFDIPGEATSKNFSHYFGMPTAELKEKEPKKNNALKWTLKCFKDCFGIEGSTIDFNALVGKKGWVVLGKGKDNRGEYQNNITQFISGAKQF